MLLHGLTDSPYSLRHIAARYRNRGFVAVAIRLPAHGTVPAALTEVDWETWLAATRLAVREARRRAPDPAPLHIVGFSNGGSLALKYTLDAIEDKRLAQANRLILISPMVGITRFARFAGFAGLPAIFPAFAKAAWLSVLPEFNPFKYNSFPVNGARQSYRLTDALRAQMSLSQREGRLTALPPILTFQSVMDFTVSTQAVLSGLYDQLPANGSELVLFDVNRNVKFGPLLRASAEAALSRLVPSGVRNYRLTIVTNAGEGTDDAVERVVEAGATAEQTRPLGVRVSERSVFAFACRVAFPAQQLSLWPHSRPLRGFRRPPGLSRAARRTRRADRQSRRPAAHVLEPILFLYGAAYRRTPSSCSEQGLARARRTPSRFSAASDPGAAIAAAPSSRDAGRQRGTRQRSIKSAASSLRERPLDLASDSEALWKNTRDSELEDERCDSRRKFI